MSSIHGEIGHAVELEHLDTLSDLSVRENARWLALLIDTEGAIGWTSYYARSDKIDERYRYEYRYTAPYLSATMSERESRKTIDEGSSLIGTSAYTEQFPEPRGAIRTFAVTGRRAHITITYMKPYLDKFSKMADLILTLFKHHNQLPTAKFTEAIEQLFGRYIAPRDANDILLGMSEKDLAILMEKAHKLADRYLD